MCYCHPLPAPQVGGVYLILSVPTSALDTLKASPVVAQLMPDAVFA